MWMTRFVIGILSLGLIVLGSGVAFGQTYPYKPIRIVTNVVGGGSDFEARLIAQGIAGPLGQPVIVENRGGIVHLEIVSKALPDGYTLLLTGGNFYIGPLLQKTSYDPVRDFSPITLTDKSINVLVVNPSLPVKSVKELIALAKARPGALNYSSGSIGGPTHLGAELFKSMAGVNIVRVPYSGGGPVLNALIGGEVQLSFITAPAVTPHVKSGKLRALAVTSAEPSALAPGLPPVAASLPGFESVSITGMLAAAKTPAAIINKLNQEIVRFITRPDVKQRFFEAGVEIVGSLPEQFAAYIKSDMATMGKLIKDANIAVER